MKKLKFFIVFLIPFFLLFYSNTECKILFSFAQGNNEKIVTIPIGSANPEVDITKFTQKQWYIPSQITINVNDTVRWINNDTESHTVTSGLGGGLASAATNSKGKPDGLFDSGLFKPGSSWTFKFNKSGTFNYFCTIHPWMEGIVQVKDANVKIPSYSVNQNGIKIGKFPLYNLTTDKKFEIGLSWTPPSIKTNEPINFIIDSFKMPQNTPLHLWPYNFILIQNGKEIYRTNGITQMGSSAEKYIFNSPGKVIIKIESGQDPHSFIEYGTIVYKNPNSFDNTGNIQNISKPSSSGLINSLALVYSIYAIVIGLPTALVVFIILIKKGII
ncbi:MAG: cupredoxin family copper-binding protein [Thermoproteota archaeon]|nr:cupredoxin family copper-binding protein [Thermoproteota archaeon]